MGRRRRSLLDPRGVGSAGGATPGGDEGSSEVDWRSQEAGEYGRSSGSGADFDDDGTDAPQGPVRFSSATSGPTLVNETPDSGDPMSTPPRSAMGRPPDSAGAIRMPPPAGYSRPEGPRGPTGQRLEAAVDAPVAQDLFGEGGYDDFEGANPPTDEFPAQVMEDVGQPYTTPFSVPDAPPIPGIVDRFTPPPAHRTEMGSRRKKPDYLAETPHAKDRYQPTPSPIKRKSLPRSAGNDAVVDRSDDPPAVSPLAVWVGVGGVLFFLVGVVCLIVALIVVAMSSRDETDAGDREVVSGGVEVRDKMTRPPSPMVDPTELPVVGADAIEDPPEVPAPPPDPQAPVPAVAPEAPKPVPPTPTPAPAAAPVGNQGVLKIRSNRRVLAYVDNRAIGYTPQDVPVEPGKHRVTAKIPGQPNSEQGRDAVMQEKKMDILVEFSF